MLSGGAVVPLVPASLGIFDVVETRKLLDPISGVAGHFHSLAGRLDLRDEPEDVLVATV